MSRRTVQTLRIVGLALLTLLSQGFCAPAQAVSPPPIDDRWLPEPSPAAPPQPTVQREMCTVGTSIADRRGSDVPSQFDGVDLDRVWRLTRGSGQLVAIIDTGVARHARLPDMVAGGDYVFTGDGTQDCDGHGTLVAGIIAAAADPNGTDGFRGIAPEAGLISIRQSSTKFGPLTDPSSSGYGDVNTMAMAVRTAADLGASVINISSVACVPTDSVLDDRALGAALAYAVDVKNAVVVAAAGNTGGAGQCPDQSPPQGAETTWETATVAVSPAWYDDYVLTVGSVNSDGEPSNFTLAGPWVDVAAPGEAVISLSPIGDGLVSALDGRAGATPISGTSYAAPIVSGLAALIRSRFPALTARQVMQRIKTTAHPPSGGWDSFVGNGVVDLLAAVTSDAGPQAVTPEAGVALAPAITPSLSTPAPPDRRAEDTAIVGATACLVVLVVVTAGTATARLRRLRIRRDSGASGKDGVAGD